MRTKNLLTLPALALLVSLPALAHDGVQNPAVMARMEGMSGIAQSMKTLGQMAKGALDFDAEIARQAAESAAQHAAMIPDLFAEPEDDPKSEALPAIWENFDRFSAIAADLEKAALAASQTISAPRDLGSAMQSMGASCKSCHSDFRK